MVRFSVSTENLALAAVASRRRPTSGSEKVGWVAAPGLVGRGCFNGEGGLVLEVADLVLADRTDLLGKDIGLHAGLVIRTQERGEVEPDEVSALGDVAHREALLDSSQVRTEGEVEERLASVELVRVGARGGRDAELLGVDAGESCDLQYGVLALVRELDLFGVELGRVVLQRSGDVCGGVGLACAVPGVQQRRYVFVVGRVCALGGGEVAGGHGLVGVHRSGCVELQARADRAGASDQDRVVGGLELNETLRVDLLAVHAHNARVLVDVHAARVDALDEAWVTVEGTLGNPPPRFALEEQVLDSARHRHRRGTASFRLVQQVVLVDDVLGVFHREREFTKHGRDQVTGTLDGGDLNRLAPGDARCRRDGIGV